MIRAVPGGPMPAFGIPSPEEVFDKIINGFAKKIWEFTDGIMKFVFHFMEKSLNPTISYTPDGPFASVYPITLWLGLFITVALGFIQAARVAAEGGRGFGGMLKGIGMWMLAWAVGLTVLQAINVASGEITKGIVTAGFNVDSWGQLADGNTLAQDATKSLSGLGLAIVSIFFILPFAIGLLIELLVREGSMLIIAATFPIFTAGLVHEKFARWFWTGLRWMLALIFMTPVIAIGMVIGNSIAKGASTGASQGNAVGDAGIAMVAYIIYGVSLVAPLLLFKLFAFVDPNTASGSGFRSALGVGGMAGLGSFLGSGGGGGGGDDASSDSGDDAEGISGDGQVPGKESVTGNPLDAGGNRELGDNNDSSVGGAEGNMLGSGRGGLAGGFKAIGVMGSAATGRPRKFGAQAGSDLDSAGVGHRSLNGAGPFEDDQDQDRDQRPGDNNPDRDDTTNDLDDPQPDEDVRDTNRGPDDREDRPDEHEDHPDNHEDLQPAGSHSGGGGGKPKSGGGGGGAKPPTGGSPPPPPAA